MVARRSILLTIFGSFSVHGLILLAFWYVVSPYGHGGLLVQMISIWLGTPLLLSILAIPLLLVLAYLKKTRRTILIILACCLIYAVIGGSLLQLTHPICMAGFRQLAQGSQPLVDAIQEYSEKEGHPPSVLQDLVPVYLAAIPSTDMPAYPVFVYETNPERWDGNLWVLIVQAPLGYSNYDQFLYYPMQNYPDEGHGGTLEKVGYWAYIHE